MIFFLILTALTVSIDSLVGGFSLSMKAKNKLPIIVGIGLTVFVMCLITNYGTMFLTPIINERTASLGGVVLIGVGLYNLLNKSDNSIKEHNTLTQILLTGFAVGLDGAFANLSLSLMGINEFYVPVIIALTHALMISLGVFLAETSLVKKLAKIEFVAPVILILLGVYKLLGLLI